ncbi:MAG: hypothetical protein K0R80_3438 [Clostridia bacterium]|nr:hypothetical protein [Clostridia bacterium]MDF2893071.1 hypothetical protein [Clostridia bacterium]
MEISEKYNIWVLQFFFHNCVEWKFCKWYDKFVRAI